jgi:hypothetical protein
MTPQKKPRAKRKRARPDKPQTGRNGALHIPLDFETAVEGLLHVKPKKKRPEK